MSQKVTSKNLSYNSSLPPFLQAMRAQAGGNDEPQTIGQRRQAKKRSGSEDAEDVPLVVDDDGNVVNVEVDKEGVVKSRDEPEKEEDDDKTAKKESDSGKASIGGRKRKVGKVVGEAAEDNEEQKKGKDTKDKDAKADKTDDEPKEKKPKKKAKKIKLSFDDEEG